MIPKSKIDHYLIVIYVPWFNWRHKFEFSFFSRRFFVSKPYIFVKGFLSCLLCQGFERLLFVLCRRESTTSSTLQNWQTLVTKNTQNLRLHIHNHDAHIHTYIITLIHTQTNTKTHTHTHTHAHKPQRYINKNRVRYRYLDNEVSCQQLFCYIRPAI